MQKLVYGDIVYCSTYNEGYFIVETLENETWYCYPINKEDNWDSLYELINNNEKISCYVEDAKYNIQRKAYFAAVIL